ncbi:hypothetical protein FG168_14485 [Vibrio cholerae]|nr:hypothetical protein [Vibrio cholerae]EKF9273593.1 hypothetical protein [Vibrio cholerae]EKF9890605.1 hypothetical protein [Vibrio cholerae]
MQDKKTTLEDLASKESKSPDAVVGVSPPKELKPREDVSEWHAQFWIKLALVVLGVMITIYAGYLSTRVLRGYYELVKDSNGSALLFPSGVALLIIPIFVAGITFVLSAAKLLTKHNKEDESNFDKFMSAINPVLSAINIYLRTKSGGS